MVPSDGDCGKRKGWWLGPDPVSLDSNHGGYAYLHYKNYGYHQKWELIPDNDFYQLKNVATGLYLDSNHGGDIYTLQHNGSNFQKWRMIHHAGNSFWFKNVATGRQLDCHRYKAYTWPPNDESSQRWYIFDE